MGITLRVGQQVPVSVQERDSGGGAVPPVGPFSWSSSNPSVASVTPGLPTTSATVTALAPGNTTIQANGDGLAPNDTVTVTNPPASATLVWGTPT